jgi:two-component system chemotaxis response regulator CheY
MRQRRHAATHALENRMPLPVLIVDDSAMSRKLTIKALPKDWDIEITQASNGIEALEAYRRGKAHLMFLDLTMPQMNGFQVLEALQGEGLDCLVIVLTADVQPQAEQRARELGAAAFLGKPVRADEVQQALTEFGVI